MASIRRPKKKDDPLAGDLSDVIGNAQWRKVRFIFVPKDKTLTLRMPAVMVESAKKLAKRKGVKYQALMREAIADYLVKEG